jgi:putative inorganic carbon (hco3(-)) transporter
MRDILLAILIVIPTVWALRAPWIGVLAWTVLSIMNPHRLSYVLYSLPVAAAVAGATLVGIGANTKQWRLRLSAPLLLLILLTLWYCVTLPFSVYFESSFPQWSKVMKINFMVIIAIGLIHDKKQIIALLWALVVSLGFYGFKGGIFTLATGGSYHVWGPEGTYIEGNNELALALIMIIPLMQALRYMSSNINVRRLLLLAMCLTVVAAIGSQSRGALLAIVSMAGIMWWRGKNRLAVGIAMILLSTLILSFMPASWFHRMDTIGEYQADESAMGRINAWWMAWNLAKANFFGGGFDVYTPAIFSLYAPVPEDVHAAHSIYFQILGEHGFIGLAIYIAVFTSTWFLAGKLRRLAMKFSEINWLSSLCAMCQVSLVAYAVGGAFLSLAYFDLPYYILVIVVSAEQWMIKSGYTEAKLKEKNSPQTSNSQIPARA